MLSNFIDSIKLPLQGDRPLRKTLYRILGFYPHNLEIYRIALAHKSHVYRNRKGRSFNNERLEFLGDAILEAVVSDIVFHRYERHHEGFLTSTRSKIVQRATLGRIAQEIGLEDLIQAPGHRRGHNSYIGGNAFEALVGAAYIDRGYKCCQWFIRHRIIGKVLDLDNVANKEVNFKSKLLEWSQKNKIDAQFTYAETTDEKSASPLFSSTIFIEGLKAGEGKGFSKKESQQKAAREALTKLRREPQFVDSIFREKEKRTAMESEPICVIPQIDEIEQELIDKEQRQADAARRSRKDGGRRSAEPKAQAATKQALPKETGKTDTIDEAEASAGKSRKAHRGSGSRRNPSRKDPGTENVAEDKKAQDAAAPKVNSGETEAKASQTVQGKKPVNKNETNEVGKDRGTNNKSEATGEVKERRTGNRRQRPRKPQLDAEQQSESIKEREALIQAAEEAAFSA